MNEALVAFAVFSIVVSHSFNMTKWLYGITKTSHERYRAATLALMTQEARESFSTQRR